MFAEAGSQTVQLPSDALRALADGCLAAGEDSVEVVREAGRRAGRFLERQITGEADPAEADPASYWEVTRDRLVEAGLGETSYRVVDAGVASIAAEGLPEAADHEGTGRGTEGCPFSAGLFGGLLSAAADRPVAVLEVECRSRGDDRCRFLVGSEERLADLRDRIVEGASLEEALEGP